MACVRVMVVGSGAYWSTKDVENGAVEGLEGAGVEVKWYAYDHRLQASADYLTWVYRRSKKRDPNAKRPTASDVQYHALVDVLPRALAQDVDAVLVVSAIFVPLPFMQVLKKAGLRVALLLTESPYSLPHELEWAKYTDLLWTNERSVVDLFRAVQPQSHYLPHAYRTSVHMPVAEDGDLPSHDVVFVGTGFPERIAWLESMNWDGIDLGLYGNWQRVRRSSPIKRFVRAGIVENVRVAGLYRRAKIGLNLYRTSADWQGRAHVGHAESLNPRAYELAACGVFHLSDHRDEVVEKFGASVPTFVTAAECEALMRAYLADDVRRASVAAQLPAKVAGDTWEARGRLMAAHLEAALHAEMPACA